MGRASQAAEDERTPCWIARLAGMAVVLAVALAACDEEGNMSVRPSGTTVQADYELSGFTSVEINTAFVAEVRRSDDYAVSVTVDDNLVDRLRVEVKDGVLRIGFDSVSFRGTPTLLATIALPDVRSLTMSGSVRATVVGFDRLESLSIRLSGASRLEGELQAAEVEASISGSSVLAVTGVTERARLEASGASSLALFNLRVSRASVDVSGSSQAQIAVFDVLERASASGASRITYRGSPALRDVSASGASRVEPE